MHHHSSFHTKTIAFFFLNIYRNIYTKNPSFKTSGRSRTHTSASPKGQASELSQTAGTPHTPPPRALTPWTAHVLDVSLAVRTQSFTTKNPRVFTGRFVQIRRRRSTFSPGEISLFHQKNDTFKYKKKGRTPLSRRALKMFASGLTV